MSAQVARDGDALVLTGALARTACAPLWARASRLLDGVRRIDLAGTERVDSAGLALLAELAARCPGATITGRPADYAELRAAYRLDEALAFAR